MRKLWQKIVRFFLFPSNAPLWLKLMPYLVLGVLTAVVISGSVFVWDYTNSNTFCGTTCHTMPPQYTTYLRSPHARVECVECHLGRDTLRSQIPKKAEHSYTLYALLFHTYEYPIVAKQMKPANEACETCHFPQKFSNDAVKEIKTFAEDEANTPSSTMLVLKIGGGSARQGLGKGIHWHIENNVEFYTTDTKFQQEIPYIKVTDVDGNVKEYFDVSANLNPEEVQGQKLVHMDCISCHNRVTHDIPNPSDAVDEAMLKNIIPADLPYAKKEAVTLLSAKYADSTAAVKALGGFEDVYAKNYPDVYNTRKADVQKTAQALQDMYSYMMYPEQKLDWTTHPSNLGHKDDPGCFRCHDGKHMTSTGEAVRSECNLCHSIPVVTGPKNLVTNIEIVRGPEPTSHTHSSWIALHGKSIDASCASCHPPKDPSVDYTKLTGKPPIDGSFCGNSACHQSEWKFAAYDSPALAPILEEQLKTIVKATPVPVAADAPKTYEGALKAVFDGKCQSCHSGSAAMAGLDLTSYQNILKGGQDGPGVTPNDLDKSQVYQKQIAGGHYGQLSDEELALLKDWIMAGAPEK